MKIALVADTFPPMRTSGAVQLRDLAQEFVRQGHDLTVLLPTAGLDSAWKVEVIDGARVVRLIAPKTKDVCYVRRTMAEWLMPYAMRLALARSPLAEERWDGVVWYSPSIFHGPFVKFLKLQSGCRGYLIIRDIFPEWAADIGLIRPGIAYSFFKKVAQSQYAAADIIGVQTPGNLDYFVNWEERAAGCKVEVLQNWLGPQMGTTCRIRVDETCLTGRKVLVYAGNMGVSQGMDIVLDLAERMRQRDDLGFLLVGRGSEVARLRARAAAATLDNILFCDEIDPNEIPDLYAQCHVGIIALNTRHNSHNIPGKFLSYLQNGLPVLANVNAGNDLAGVVRSHRVGEVCESNELEEFVMKCEVLIDKIASDSEVNTRCRELIQKFYTVEKTVKQIVSALAHS